MLDPATLYQLETDTPLGDMNASVMVVALGGFIDAGQTQRLVSDQILSAHTSTVVASFDVDQLLDYRGRRPTMVFDRDHWSSYDEPSLVLHRVLDREGVPFFLLSGPEPDYQWNRMAEALLSLTSTLGVDVVASVHGIPMATPHTRPIGVTAHGTNPALVGHGDAVFGAMQVPASFTAMFEYRLGEAGRDAIGWAVHVPHYLGQTEYADAALTGLERLTAATGLDLENTSLATTAGQNRTEIARQLEESAEIAAVVAALEQQYDTFMEGQNQPSLLATDVSELPTADEIGAELEAFLKGVDGATGVEAEDETDGSDASDTGNSH